MIMKKDQEIGTIIKKAQNGTSMEGVLAIIRRCLTKNRHFSIISANPEITLLALKDQKLALIIDSADILINDGVGLSIANDFLKRKSYKNKVLAFFIYIFQWFDSEISFVFSKNKGVLKGRDLFLEIVKLGNKLGLKVFFLGGSEDEALKTEEKLEYSFKNIEISSDQGPILNGKGLPVSRLEEEKEKEVINKINLIKPDYLFVAFGAPKQEYWIERNMDKLNVNGVMSVGGTFNYISGNRMLPLSIFEKLGLEWFWRLITEPKRIKRIYNAFVVFPLKVLFYKLTQN